MRVLIVYAHPEPRSFNGTLRNKTKEVLEGLGHTVEISDLYGEGFDPVEKPAHYRSRAETAVFSPLAEQRHASFSGTLPAEVTREIERLERAAMVIFQFPLWWHGLPAILKGWFDRVFVSGGLYTGRIRYDRGYFRGKRAMLALTTGAPAETFVPGGRGGDIETLLWPVQYSLHYMGFTVLPPFVAYGVQGNGFTYQDTAPFNAHLESHVQAWHDRLETLDELTPLTFPGWADWDSAGRPKHTGIGEDLGSGLNGPG